MGTLFYIIGLIGGELHYDQMRLSLFFTIIITITVIIAVFYNNKYIGIYLLFTFLGIVSMVLNPVLKQENIFLKNTSPNHIIAGEVLEVKEYEYQNQYIIKPNKESNIKTNIKIEVGKQFKTARQGDIIVAEGNLECLGFQRNPGAFNERSYLLIRGISAKLKAEMFNVEQTGKKLAITRRIRDYYGQIFERIMPENEAQIMKAMLLGDKVFLSKEIQELYKDVGIAHVLAISGLHISVIAGVLWWLLKRIGLNKNLQSIIVVVILWMYAALTGFSVSITRSAIMMSIIIIGTLIEEKPDPITSWSFAALVLLVYNNLYLWDIGFQLSFVAVGSLILLTPFFRKIYIIPEKIRNYIAPMIAVTLGTTPVIAYYYYVISPIGILMNLLLIPLITIVVIIGFIAMLISPIHLLLAKGIIGSAYYLLKIIEKSSQLALKIPFSTLIIGRPDFLELSMYLLFIGLILWYLKLTLEQRQKIKNYVIGINILLVVFIGLKRVIPGDLSVTFLDVGQGDSIVITTPHHKTFIIDGGDVGNGKKIEQFLKYNGISRVHGAILSHAHSDHMDGLGELALSYPFEKLFLSQIPIEDTHFKAFYDIIQSEHIPVHKMSAKDVIKDKDIEMTCIYPIQGLNQIEGNDASVVLVLKHNQVSYYFTGDIEAYYEKEMARNIEKNHINILKVPHHGSKTSSTQELITQVAPDVAIISCGKKNRYNHPHTEVVDRYRVNKVPVQTTKDVGAVITYSNGETVKMNLMEDKRMLWK